MGKWVKVDLLAGLRSSAVAEELVRAEGVRKVLDVELERPLQVTGLGIARAALTGSAPRRDLRRVAAPALLQLFLR